MKIEDKTNEFLSGKIDGLTIIDNLKDWYELSENVLKEIEEKYIIVSLLDTLDELPWYVLDSIDYNKMLRNFILSDAYCLLEINEEYFVLCYPKD